MADTFRINILLYLHDKSTIDLVLNETKYRPAGTNPEAIARLPQVETNSDLDRPPSEEEVKKAIE